MPINRYVVAFTIALNSGACLAGPDATARFLMNDPISAMDFGIYQLQQMVQRNAEPKLNNATESFVVGYNLDSNRITVSTYLLPQRQWPDRASAKAVCKGLFSRIRATLGVNPLTGKGILGGHSIVATLFVHAGYADKRKPNDFAKKIDQLVRLKASVPIIGGKELKCQAPLLGKDVFNVVH